MVYRRWVHFWDILEKKREPINESGGRFSTKIYCSVKFQSSQRTRTILVDLSLMTILSNEMF